MPSGDCGLSKRMTRSTVGAFGGFVRLHVHLFSRLCFCGVALIFSTMTFAVETEQETDGRWIAEIPQIPGAMAYGATRKEAVARAEALARIATRTGLTPHDL